MSDINIFVIVILIIAVLVFFRVYYTPGNSEMFQIYNTPQVKCLTGACESNPLSSAKCWNQKYFPCPWTDGSYMQCTNNFKRKVNSANCNERSYEYSQPDERLSEKCVYNNVFPFKLKKNKYKPNTPSIFPRVNRWRNDSIENNFFVNVN